MSTPIPVTYMSKNHKFLESFTMSGSRKLPNDIKNRTDVDISLGDDPKYRRLSENLESCKKRIGLINKGKQCGGTSPKRKTLDSINESEGTPPKSHTSKKLFPYSYRQERGTQTSRTGSRAVTPPSSRPRTRIYNHMPSIFPRSKTPNSRTEILEPQALNLRSSAILSQVGVEKIKVKIKTFQNGDQYEGQLNKEGKPNGTGKMRFKDGTYYAGEWLGGIKHGKGIEVGTDKVVYQGEFKNGNKEGYANIDYGNGSHYSGYLKEGEFVNYGIYIWANGKRYEGEWDHGLFCGKGSVRYPNGDKYCGEFINGLKDGYGIFNWVSGPSYKGSWKKGKRDGEGLHTQANGLQFPVLYREGQRTMPQQNIQKFSTFFDNRDENTKAFLMRKRKMMTLTTLGANAST